MDAYHEFASPIVPYVAQRILEPTTIKTEAEWRAFEAQAWARAYERGLKPDPVAPGTPHEMHAIREVLERIGSLKLSTYSDQGSQRLWNELR